MTDRYCYGGDVRPNDVLLVDGKPRRVRSVQDGTHVVITLVGARDLRLRRGARVEVVRFHDDPE